MKQAIERAAVHFNEHGMPVSDVFDDIYFSNDSGLAESEYVFIKHNNLRSRFTTWPADTPFVIAETGFGTGLNFLLAATAFLKQAPADARLHFVSFERFPLEVDDLQKALAHWTELANLSEELIAQYPLLIGGCHRLSFAQGRVTLDLWLADVLEALPDWQYANPDSVHAWFLDGFAPAKNPQMWQAELYQAMARSAAADCTLATFTAVGSVRRGLQQVGFRMRKVAGFGSKREMLSGTYRTPSKPRPRSKSKIAIIGGGIAAATLATKLSVEDCEVEVFCADSELAGGASGNPQGAVYPLLQADFTPATAIYSQAYSAALRFYQRYSSELFHSCGVLQLAFNETQAKRQQKVVSRTQYPTGFVTAVNAEQASDLAGVPVPYPALFYSGGGWLEPAKVVRRLFSQARCKVHLNQQVESLQRTSAGWQIVTANQRVLFDEIILASGHALSEFDKAINTNQQLLHIRPVRGQVTQLKTTPLLAPLQAVVCHKGYITPAHHGCHCVGATFDKHNSDSSIRREDDQHNIELLRAQLPELLAKEVQVTGQRASIRATTADHLPVVGAMPRFDGQHISNWPGVWVLGGLGSRGFTSAPWCAELLVAQMFNRPLPVGESLRRSVSPQRFIQRKLARQTS